MNLEASWQRRVRRELKAHTDDDVLTKSYRLKDRFAHIWSYPSRKRLFAELERVLEEVDGKRVLDYGCGRGEGSLKYLMRGATVWGIDISPIYIAEAKRKAEDAGFRGERCQFHVMDAHALAFGDETFDLVVGEGILHHLEAQIALREIFRVLKRGGRVLLQEPLADNPLFGLFRSLTPGARTKDERPFSGKDIASLMSQDRWRSDASYCGVIEAPVAMITSVLLRNRPDNGLLRGADRLERWMHNKGVLLPWNQYILFNLVKQ